MSKNKQESDYLLGASLEDEFKLSMTGSESGSDGSSGSSEGDSISKIAQCIRNVGNFSQVKPHDILDKVVFNEEYLQMRMPMASPKLMKLFERIEELDALDKKRFGKVFKHMIFTDLQSSTYGIKTVASAFLVKGFHPAFKVHGTGFHVFNDEELEKDGRNFGVLASKNIFDRSMSAHYKKALLTKFNARPTNVNGKQIRFILLDQGFKEGIDLYDIKYVHLLEPLFNKADEKQAIGRGTRFCGQKGLTFHPTFGWPLYVFRYDVDIPGKTGIISKARTINELFMEYADIDMRRLMFAADVEDVSIDSAVDHHLTSPVHGFEIEMPPPVLQKSTEKQEGGYNTDVNDGPLPPRRKLKLREMHDYIKRNFSRFEYPEVKLENMCGGAEKVKKVKNVRAPKKASEEVLKEAIVNFTPTQDFVRHYFTPSSPYKGLLLWHSVGTGKTCTAIATASSSFEREGYSILWVTRHTLKSDIFKNLFKQVCSTVLQEKLKAGTWNLPTKIAGQMGNLGPEWIEPISYKQFTNLLLKKNKFYAEMVKRNGTEDPLRKTLLIVDEAHKLYAPSVAASEKPDTDILESMIQHSYKVSGKDSVRLLVMTATPYTEDGMELIQLLNLMREKMEQFPTDFEEFTRYYLDNTGKFTLGGKRLFMNEISGYISYLNRSKDARNFSYPVLEDVLVPLSREVTDEDKLKEKEAGLKFKLDSMKNDIKEAKRALRGDISLLKNEAKEKAKEMIEEKKGELLKEAEKCISDVEESISELKKWLEAEKERCNTKHTARGEGPAKKACKDKVTEDYKVRLEVLKEEKKECNELKKGKGEISKQAREEVKELIVDEISKLDKRFKESHSDYFVLLDEFNKYKEERKNNTQQIKDMKEDYAKARSNLKEIKMKLAKARKQIKRIKNKDMKKRSQKRLRETIGQEYKKEQEKYVDMKNDITILKIKNKVLRIKQGAATVGDISQEKALTTRCNV